MKWSVLLSGYQANAWIWAFTLWIMRNLISCHKILILGHPKHWINIKSKIIKVKFSIMFWYNLNYPELYNIQYHKLDITTNCTKAYSKCEVMYTSNAYFISGNTSTFIQLIFYIYQILTALLKSEHRWMAVTFFVPLQITHTWMI